MIVESKPTRRGFVAAAAAVASVGAYAASLRVAKTLGFVAPDGKITWVNTDAVASGVASGTIDAWRAAVGTTVRIACENGLVEGRVLTVERGVMGGDRPDTARPETLIVTFETDVGRAPVGDRIYAVESVVTVIRDLFLTRGPDVLGRAVLTAVLN